MMEALSLSPASSPEMLTRSLLAWYDVAGRHLPWRLRQNERPDPYRVWLSEIMLQQTTVAAVIGYYNRFLERWPTITSLANSPVEDVMTAWAGLGYYARARNMHKCAQIVAQTHHGQFPDTEEALRKLPGIGIYTAAAIASIAFGKRAVVVDGNVERVMARLFAVETPLPAARNQLTALAERLTPTERSGDYAQAVMDLGATLCTPRSPACGLCPWMRSCIARKKGLAETLPHKQGKAEKPTRHTMAFWIVHWDGSVLLRRRPPKGLLGGMMEIPSTPWRETPGIWSVEEAAPHAPLSCDWKPVRGTLTHTFTHFHLILSVVTGIARGGEPPACRWVNPQNMRDEALPAVMNKIVRLASGQT